MKGFLGLMLEVFVLFAAYVVARVVIEDWSIIWEVFR